MFEVIKRPPTCHPDFGRSVDPALAVLGPTALQPHPATRHLRSACSWVLSAVVTVMVFSTSILFPPFAVADSAANLTDAFTSARSQTSCRPLQYNPVVEQAAKVINRSVSDYLSHTAKRVPISDPLEGLKDLGYGGSKAYLLQGAGRSDDIAIKGALLEGYAYYAISDCSCTDLGVSIQRNETTAYSIAAVVIARA